VCWLLAKPADICADKEHFTMMNAFSKEDDCVFVCHFKGRKGNIWVEYLPQPIDLVAMEI
jgi:hypothetical protein